MGKHSQIQVSRTIENDMARVLIHADGDISARLEQLGVDVSIYHADIGVITATAHLGILESIARLPEVGYIKGAAVLRPALDVSVPEMNVDDVWQRTDTSGRKLTGKDVIIGVVDSGIDYTHPDFWKEEKE